MFSGLSNQVTSWMGSVKGEPQDEEVPTPTATLQNDTQQAAAGDILSQENQQPLEEVPIASEGDEGVKVQRCVHFFFILIFSLFKK